jgi:hypothetical protein
MYVGKLFVKAVNPVIHSVGMSETIYEMQKSGTLGCIQC